MRCAVSLLLPGIVVILPFTPFMYLNTSLTALFVAMILVLVCIIFKWVYLQYAEVFGGRRAGGQRYPDSYHIKDYSGHDHTDP
jgi:hypothetical protein